MIHLCTEGGKDPQIWKSFKLNYTILGPNLGFSDLRCGDWSWYVYYNPRIGAEVSVFRSKRHYLGRSYWEQVGLFVPKTVQSPGFDRAVSCCLNGYLIWIDLHWICISETVLVAVVQLLHLGQRLQAEVEDGEGGGPVPSFPLLLVLKILPALKSCLHLQDGKHSCFRTHSYCSLFCN